MLGPGGLSLGGGEGQGEVVASVARVQAAVVEGVGEEAVEEGAEGQAAAPAPREVLHLHVLPRAEGGQAAPHGLPWPPHSQPPILTW